MKKRILQLIAFFVIMTAIVACNSYSDQKVKEKTFSGFSQIMKATEDGKKGAIVKSQKQFRKFYSKLKKEQYYAFFEGYREYDESDDSDMYHLVPFMIINGSAEEAAYLTTFLFDVAERVSDPSLANRAIEWREICYYRDSYTEKEKAAARKIIDSWMERKAAERAELEESLSPENQAVDIMEAFYKAVSSKDMDAYYGIDYEAGEMEFDTDEEWERYNNAEQQWKKDNPKKWKAIKEFRKKKISEGAVFSIVDMD